MGLSEILMEKIGNPNTPEVQSKLKLWIVPDDITSKIPCWPKKIYCHPLLAEKLEMCLSLVIFRKLEKMIKTFDGCYNVRMIRGVSNVYSVHSWGLAFDINASENKLGDVPSMPGQLVSCFLEYFDWGGNFRRKDGMHFQIKPELL